ncbi:glucosaminidase domain-containing protein [Catellicoccus marimammalium]|uniref:Peptidoglycan hydrolase n=1 Tax=Catellicoccus marimammalium M35/04/3 TaxID=1234409 RepID=K8ZMP3_9ENTE|nr:glucosaminidase domain-containing protein [Catellicoccus marimammalium]EKU27818.1 Peptidoglycan hydrolase, Autolysin2 [Catellicoccus marimammalium M35/04/3]
MKKKLTATVTLATLLSSSTLPELVQAAEATKASIVDTASTEDNKDDKKTEEEKQKEEEQKKEEEVRKKAEAEKKKEEERKKKEAEKKRKEEERKKKEAEKKRKEEEARKKAEAEKRKEELKKKEEAEKKEEADKKKEEQKRKEEERKKKEAEKKRKEEEVRKKAEAEKRAEEARKKAEAEKRAEEARKKAEAEKCAEEARKKAETEKRKAEKKKQAQLKAKKEHHSTYKAAQSLAVSQLDAALGLGDDVDESPIKITANMTGKEFIEAIAEYASEIAEENDLYASVMIAQACLETGFGTSGLSSSPYYNFFGIKGSYKGKSVVMATLEDGPNGMYSINDAFRDYPSPKESLEDYAKLLSTDFYKGAHKSNTDSYRDATRFLTGRYATDRNYARKLNGIIEAYDLTKYDDGEVKKKRIKKIKKVYHKVQAGDTANKLAKKYKVKTKQLAKWNKDEIKDINLIYPGQKLVVNQKVTYEYVKDNDKDHNKDAKKGEFNLPLKKGSFTVTSPFGNRTAPNAAAGNYHEGIDLAVPMNSNVYASKEGVVFAKGYHPSAGNYIFIYHGNGLFTNYFHLNRQLVKVGDKVKAGQLIAKSGSTGNSTGPHLHFGVSHRLWGDYEDPTKYVDFD